MFYVDTFYVQALKAYPYKY